MRLETTTRTGSADQFAEVLPPSLERLLDECGVKELAAHRQLATRYREAADHVGHARREVEQAAAADTEAERRFAHDAAAKLPTPKAQKARERLERAEREHEVLGRELIKSASALVAAAAPYIGEAAERVAQAADRDADDARAAREAALEALGRRGPTAREAGWLSVAQDRARVYAWRPAVGTPDAAQQAVRQALAAHDEEAARRRERREQRLLEEEVVRLHEGGLPLHQARDEALKKLAGSAA